MTRKRAKELAPIIAAYGEGKKVQFSVKGCDEWIFATDPILDDDFEYRIAPESRKRPMTRDEVLNFLAEHPNALVRHLNSEWFLSGSSGYPLKPESYSYCLVENGVRSEPRKFEIEEDSDE